jgi:small-conductance mechanosensitive channel
LLAQGVALILIGLFNVDLSAGLQAVFESNSFFATLPALGLVALLAGVGFFSLRPGAWVMAMLVQGLVLLVALAFYFLFQARNLLLYGMMAYSVMMVIYLNYAEVPAVFRVQPALLSEREEENVG